ncbi:hypothetical protein [Altererythrobacter sp. ZODW24]|uniref:hypothetical protein n=1 Tax=Altererythrobacter sp. ZODW24 TaxID=2185142 RepID=UPI000DF79300|nr:hypothetical protein [Altererythrobacter sp. ZODW24]
MTSQPPQSSFGKSAKSAPEAEQGTEFRAKPSSMSTRWAALNDAGNAVATMAGLIPEATTSQIRNFPAVIRDAGGWRLEMAESGIQDLAAFMEPGLAALLAVNARGQDASAPALALWHEFHAARAALLTLPPETGKMGPRRSA